MRKIKFRGKRKLDGKWVKGYYFKKLEHQGEDNIEEKHYILENYADTSLSSPGYKIRHNEVILETVGQYTKLKDKNGREIYEGDIVENVFGELAIVVYNAPNYTLDYNINNQKSNQKDIFWNIELEVIGNKYDNPKDDQNG